MTENFATFVNDVKMLESAGFEGIGLLIIGENAKLIYYKVWWQESMVYPDSEAKISEEAF